VTGRPKNGTAGNALTMAWRSEVRSAALAATLTRSARCHMEKNAAWAHARARALQTGWSWMRAVVAGKGAQRGRNWSRQSEERYGRAEGGSVYRPVAHKRSSTECPLW